MYVCKSIQLLATSMRKPRDVYHRGYYYMHLYACMYGTYVRIYTCIQLVLQWSETCKHVMYVYMVCMCVWSLKPHICVPARIHIGKHTHACEALSTIHSQVIMDPVIT